MGVDELHGQDILIVGAGLCVVLVVFLVSCCPFTMENSLSAVTRNTRGESPNKTTD